MTLVLNSPAFEWGQEIPIDYTCEGKDISPPLKWEGVPDGTRSLVLIIDDPDAPDPSAPKMTWTHWVVYNLPPETTGLPAGIATEDLPSGTKESINDFKVTSYRGPCPPIGRHRYFHKLYALDTLAEVWRTLSKEELEDFMASHILAQAELMGTYQKSR